MYAFIIKKVLIPQYFNCLLWVTDDTKLFKQQTLQISLKKKKEMLLKTHGMLVGSI